MAKGNTKAAQDAATQARETPDETAADIGEVAKTGAQGAQENAPTAPAADETAAQPNPNEGKQPQAALLPESVKLAAPYGFINEETNEHRYWQAGQEVSDPDEIKLLIERQAPLE